MREDYVRPVLVAVEPRSSSSRRRRRLLLALLAVIVLALGALVVARALTGGGEGNPGVGSRGPATASYLA